MHSHLARAIKAAAPYGSSARCTPPVQGALSYSRRRMADPAFRGVDQLMRSTPAETNQKALTPCAREALVCALLADRAGERSLTPHPARTSGTGADGPRSRKQVLSTSAALTPESGVRLRRSAAGALAAGTVARGSLPRAAATTGCGDRQGPSGGRGDQRDQWRTLPFGTLERPQKSASLPLD